MERALRLLPGGPNVALDIGRRPRAEVEIKYLIKILEAAELAPLQREHAYALRWAIGEKDKTPIEMRQAWECARASDRP